jgi:hypothetical protein
MIIARLNEMAEGKDEGSISTTRSNFMFLLIGLTTTMCVTAALLWVSYGTEASSQHGPNYPFLLPPVYSNLVLKMDDSCKVRPSTVYALLYPKNSHL